MQVSEFCVKMPSLFTAEEYVDMIIIYGECLKNRRRARELYRIRFPDRPTPNENTFVNLERTLRQGHFPSGNRGNSRRSVRNEENIINVLAYVNINPHVSTRKLSDELGITKSSVERILQDFKYHPFKVHLVQGLFPGDADRRLQFIAHLLGKLEDDRAFLTKIMWGDEAKFHNNGVVNRHNSNYWSPVNPHWVMETRFQNIWSVNVWCGLFNGRIIGPYFYEGTLTGERYLHFLEHSLPEFLEEIPLLERQQMWWQQDGAPAHNAHMVTNFLQNRFGNNFIANASPLLRWPARSPDLSPLDYFFWGTLKDMVYLSKPQNLEDLKNKIRNACRRITPQMIIATCTRNLLTRLEACVTAEGLHFEHLLK